MYSVSHRSAPESATKDEAGRRPACLACHCQYLATYHGYLATFRISQLYGLPILEGKSSNFSVIVKISDNNQHQVPFPHSIQNIL